MLTRIVTKLRGHDESKDSSKHGPFSTLAQLVGRHDSIVSERFLNGPRNAKYLSPEIQNRIINIMATMVRGIVCDNVREAVVFSIMADDVSHTEQMAISVRYVQITTTDFSIQEHFLHVEKLC